MPFSPSMAWQAFAVAFHGEQAEIEYDPEKAAKENLVKAIEDQGYWVA
ncbi:hypothetical protein [Sporosarcina globispora]|nr:hypothetical protein [Sporosarcina globispora]